MKALPHLNVGAGVPAPDWLNLDASPLFLLPRSVHRALSMLRLSARSEAFLGARYAYCRLGADTRLPFPDASMEAVYTSHTLEHLSAPTVRLFVEEARRVLRPQGILRIVVPDLEARLRSLLESEDAAAGFGAAAEVLPPEVAESRWRAMLEALWGFPSMHRTMLRPEPWTRAYSRGWDVRTGLGYLESEIAGDLLRAVEREERCQHACIIEMTKRG